MAFDPQPLWQTVGKIQDFPGRHFFAFHEIILNTGGDGKNPVGKPIGKTIDPLDESGSCSKQSFRWSCEITTGTPRIGASGLPSQFEANK